MLKRVTGSALKDLAILRDGGHCPLTGYPFFPPGAVIPRCAHIIPFSINSKTQTHAAIEMFTGCALVLKTIQDNINHPCNTLTMEINAHDAMNKHLAWGIEANSSGSQYKYYYRVVRPDWVPPTVRLRDGEEIHFGVGIGGHLLPSPDLRICNLHLAVCRVSSDCGISEIFDHDDDDDTFRVPVYFGGPFVSDDVLMRRLEALVF